MRTNRGIVVEETVTSVHVVVVHALFVIVPSHDRYTFAIKLALIGHDELSALVTHHNTRITPREIIKVPVRVDGNQEREDGDSKNRDNHPNDVLPFSVQQENDGLETVHTSNGDDGHDRDARSRCRQHVDEIHQVTDNSRLHQCAEQIKHDDKSH